MHILLTNDDGIFAPGLSAAYQQLCKLGDVTVVAPSEAQSGMSHSVTFTEPLTCNKVQVDNTFTGFSVSGSPADCVKLAYMQLCETPPDLVVAGINAGANAGINVYYSGTVAAAMEAAFLNVPAVALSMARDEPMQYERAAKLCLDIIQKLLPIEPRYVVNINIPRLSVNPPKGIKVTAQSHEGFNEYYIREKNETGQTLFQLTGDLKHSVIENGDHFDTTAVTQGYITITSLTADMTNHEKNQQIKEKLTKANFLEENINVKD